LGEYDCLSSAIADQDVSKGSDTIVVRTVDDQVLYTLARFVFEVSYKVDHTEARLEEASCYGLDPPRNGGRKHQTLDVGRSVLLDCSHNLFDVFFEAKVEHSISLVKNCVAQTRKVEVFPLHVVLHASSGTNENINASP